MIRDKYINIIIPCYNEENNILKLYTEITKNLDFLSLDYKIIYVNDNSDDASSSVFDVLMINNNKIKVINNKRRMGQSFSISEGFKVCDSEYFFTIDGDGQNNPNDFGKFIEYLNEDYDLVYGIRLKRKDTFIKKISSKIANKFRSSILKDGCIDTGCGLKMFKTSSFHQIKFFDGYHRFFPALFKGRNLKITGISVDHRFRYRGVSNYGVIKRGFKGTFDLIRVFFINLKNEK
jgi:dolichol-phosphate mannosyltransferase